MEFSKNGAAPQGKIIIKNIIKEIIKKKEPYLGQPMMFNWPIISVDFNNLDRNILMKIPPTDCRLRPDQKALEYGERDMAGDEKLKLENKQRERRKHRQTNNIEYQPNWFKQYEDVDAGEKSWGYIGGYWETRFEYYRRNCKAAGKEEPNRGKAN